MSALSKFRTLILSASILLIFSSPASAFSVWAVEGGSLASSNSAGSVLNIAPGLNQIDLYFSTDGDISWGWDITLDLTGSGTIFNVAGGDINGGLGTALANGYQQLGGDPAVDLVAAGQLLFSFSYDSLAGSLLSLTSDSSYTSGNTFSTEMLTAAPLILTTASTTVPLPAASWLLLTCFASLGLVKKRLAAL